MAYVASLNPSDWDYTPRSPRDGHGGDPSAAPAGATIEIANEFSAVRVRKVMTRNGARLEIEAPRTGHTIRLDAIELESLTWQTPATFSAFLEQPFGPEPGAQ